MATLDEIRLQQLLGPFAEPQGIARLNPLAFRFQDQFYPNIQSSDMGYAIGPYGNADTISGVPTYGYAIQPSATADDFQGSGFSGTTDMGYPFAPANRLGGLDTLRFSNVDLQPSYLDRAGSYDNDFYSQKQPTGIEKLFQTLSKIPTPMNILRGGIQSLKGFNDRLRGSMFGQSKTFAEYFQKRRDQKAAELAQQRGEIKSIQERLDKDPRGGGGGGFSPQGGGGFSTQGGPYGSGPGGIHG